MESIKGYDAWKLQSDEDARYAPRPVSSKGGKGSTQPRLRLTPEEKKHREERERAIENGACYD